MSFGTLDFYKITNTCQFMLFKKIVGLMSVQKNSAGLEEILNVIMKFLIVQILRFDNCISNLLKINKRFSQYLQKISTNEEC